MSSGRALPRPFAQLATVPGTAEAELGRYATGKLGRDP
jgi:hypothetical protein